MTEPKIRSSCDSCLGSKVKCDQTRPSCSRCDQHGQQCVYSHYRKIGRPSLKSVSSSTKQAEARCNHKSSVEHRHTHKSKKQHRLRHSDPHSAPSLSHEQADQRQSQGRNPPFGPCMPIDARHDQSAPLSPITSNSTRPSLCSEMTMLSPASWESALQAGPSISDTEPLVNGHGDDLSSLVSADWEALNDIFNLPDLSIPDLTVPLGMGQKDQHAAANPDFVTLPYSPPQSTKSACITPPNIPAQPITTTASSSLDFSTAYSNPLLTAANPLQSKQPFDSLFSDLTPLASGTHSPVSAGGPGLQTPSRSFDPTLFSWPTQPALELGCVEKCHNRLNTFIAYMINYQTDDLSLSVDFLLKLDEQVRLERSKALRCTACMEKARRGHTLMLITMLAEKVMVLFERERALALQNAKTTASSATSCGSTNSSINKPRPLVIGDMQLDSTTKCSLVRRLLSLSFQRQLDAFAQVEAMLEGAHDSDISSRITRDLLADLEKRACYLLGVQDFIGKMQCNSGRPRQQLYCSIS
ncbi:hypothetical protein K461DRAFT_268626 [Myriangium duriaei CBS 260.36]|uniref:Zn(2)-C6 fungal-type domain-containing protein n=1 Tax=Myriangium duriaei CBS 260.36 TaxID=1168546 RepID=A0A9P4MH24_9PEZI|nr:hypothetical protein K461DRAFT_268626 [Myriangium duriaei CBS 260.36]